MKLLSTITLTTASDIIDEALRLAREESLLPLTVVVLDSGGRLVAMKSEDGSGLLRYDVAYGKAWGALGMGMSSRLIRDRLSARPQFQTALAAASDGQMIPVPGGVLLENEDSFTVGAIGISGDASEKDEYCAIVAAHKAGLRTEPAEIDENWRSAGLCDQVKSAS